MCVHATPLLASPKTSLKRLKIQSLAFIPSYNTGYNLQIKRFFNRTSSPSLVRARLLCSSLMHSHAANVFKVSGKYIILV